ncbi:hypothetical protein ACFU8W_22980 [Streptomyces sp. NPDC057565]|uniref:helix-turn-helix domain-containing protein n=1 Tax=Streptomyces sp. NPDC057565 TaxID=3346169 RepID=UPI0036949C30
MPVSQDSLLLTAQERFWMGYFAARTAPMGRADPGAAAALGVFAPGMVARALPAAWQIVAPGAMRTCAPSGPPRRCAG